MALPATGLMFYIVIRAVYGSLMVQRGEIKGNDRSATFSPNSSQNMQIMYGFRGSSTHPTFEFVHALCVILLTH